LFRSARAAEVSPAQSIFLITSSHQFETGRLPEVLLAWFGQKFDEGNRRLGARQGYRETAAVLDADGATIVTLRGDGAGIHTLDSAHDKAYTSVSFKNDTLALAERAKGENSIAPLAKLPHVMFLGGGIVIKLNDEIIGAIGAAGAPGAKLDDDCARAGWTKFGIV